MPSFIPKPGDTHEVDLRDLSDHPLLASIPTWPRDCADFGSLRDSVAERGLDYDLLATTAFELVDGRNRRNVVATLGGIKGCRPGHVRVRFVESADAASVIVAALGNRRHLTKGALAYLMAPMFDAVLAESKARRQRNLVADPAARASGAAFAETAPSAGSAKNAAEVAAKMGLGARLFEQAMQLHRLFVKAGAEARATYEPRLLGPWQDEHGEWNDPVGLGYMINGITALIDGEKIEAELGKRNEHDRLFRLGVEKLRHQWDKSTPAQRAKIRAELQAELLKSPAELVNLFLDSARAAAREQAKQAVGA